MSSNFPLFLLPDNVILSVIKSMETVEQMMISILSRKTKKIVSSFNLQSYRFTLGTTESCDLEIRCFDLKIRIDFKIFENRTLREALVTEIPLIVKLYATRIVNNRLESELIGWVNRTFKVRDFIDHFMEILHHDRIDEILVSSNDLYPPESMQQLINGLEIRDLYFSEGNSDVDAMIYLNAIKPTRSFFLDGSPLFVWNHTKMSPFFIQSLDHIRQAKFENFFSSTDFSLYFEKM
ncbi:hypothetical protein CRE_26622 [Caenorhabditis remanei]|uniref:F-box domain-containing protein n=1 Tax=Caenorhabditis remanei TaxID=31234 RepID=E3MKX4_CAERE|nr:hypothetical protein CRE_26622 [Caenorhabditis remanei]